MIFPDMWVQVQALRWTGSQSTRNIGRPERFTVSFKPNQTFSGEMRFTLEQAGGMEVWANTQYLAQFSGYGAAYLTAIIHSTFLYYSLYCRVTEYYIADGRLTLKFQSFTYDLNTVKWSSYDTTGGQWHQDLALNNATLNVTTALRTVFQAAYGSTTNVVERWLPNTTLDMNRTSAMCSGGPLDTGFNTTNAGVSKYGSRLTYTPPQWSSWVTATRPYNIDTNAGVVDMANQILSDYSLYINSTTPNYLDHPVIAVRRTTAFGSSNVNQMAWTVYIWNQSILSERLYRLITDNNHVSRVLVAPYDPTHMAFNVSDITWEAESRLNTQTNRYSYTLGRGEGRWYKDGPVSQSVWTQDRNTLRYEDYTSPSKASAERLVGSLPGTSEHTGLPTSAGACDGREHTSALAVWNELYAKPRVAREVQFARNEVLHQNILYGRDFQSGDFLTSTKNAIIGDVSYSYEGGNVDVDITLEQ